MNDFGSKLQEILNEKKITQKEFAKMLNMSQSAVNTYCTGARLPSFEVLKSICIALNESADYLLGLVDWL